MWGVRCALDTGVARALGMTARELEDRLETRSLAQIAAERDVPMARVRQVAWAIAEPQLAAAVAAGAINEGERTALHRRIDEKRGPWRDLAPSGRVRARRHDLSGSSASSSSSRPAHVLGGSDAGKLSSSSSSSFASSSSSRVTRTSRSSS
jgi:hypothetical protein